MCVCVCVCVCCVCVCVCVCALLVCELNNNIQNGWLGKCTVATDYSSAEEHSNQLILLYTVDREIFVVKKFSWLAPTTKI